MKKYTRMQIVIWVCSLLPLAAVALSYARLPDQIVLHWSFGGEIAYEPKWQLWLIAGMAPMLAALFHILPRIDPKRRNYEKFSQAYRVFQLVMMLFLLIVVGAVLVEAFRPGTIEMNIAVSLLCAVLFILVGNIMPKFRHNYFCGIKTPWTLASERVWEKSNRLGGRLMFAAGVLMLPAVFLPEELRFALVMIAILVAVMIPCVMSYVWFRREQNKTDGV